MRLIIVLLANIRLFISILFMLLYTSTVSAGAYSQSWLNRAIQLQIKLDISEPLGRSTFLYTHNSYNSKAYANLGSYWDPNHQLSIHQQLEYGIRAIELDTHWTLGTRAKKEILLCHGTNKHTGCSIFDRQLTATLKEISNWLRKPNHRDQLLMIYLEDHLDGHYQEALAALNQSFGDLIYRPSNCQTLPQTVSKQDILQQGKQVILVGGNCATPAWSSTVFKDHWTTENGSFSGYPLCTTKRFSAMEVANQLIRIYEDATWLTRHFGNPPPTITPQVMQNAVNCGLGLVGAEPLKEFDPRLYAAVWSWATDEPKANSTDQHCAIQGKNGRFYSEACTNHYPYSCRNRQTNHWQITTNEGSWSQGEHQCKQAFGPNYQFDVPRSGYQNLQLLNETSSKIVWVNYQDQNKQGMWLPGDYPMDLIDE
ncbi:phosphatidylinositol-specific phospholipase C domain-containing protein [Spartinivicinus ruber]|uniref:phosphatidylinositol-specific phospholipase C domain-containing protein n=1 Tax=Spartinivicinus ruber TaxID=2683272 RepID=UPI0013D21290|nr:phosphatidylinositol-specific phospholipase C domain-containing protein [Spartinivicinus ruber]